MPVIRNTNNVPLQKEVITPCACGRKGWDHDDLCVLVEEDGMTYKSSVAMTKQKTVKSSVMCMRDGCLGKYRSGGKFMSKLPRIFWEDYKERKGMK